MHPTAAPDLSKALAHYGAMAAEAAATAQPLVIEPAEFAITGSTHSQPWHGLRNEWFSADCGSLDAPNYVPTGSLELPFDEGRYAVTSVARAGWAT